MARTMTHPTVCGAPRDAVKVHNSRTGPQWRMYFPGDTMLTDDIARALRKLMANGSGVPTITVTFDRSDETIEYKLARP